MRRYARSCERRKSRRDGARAAVVENPSKDKVNRAKQPERASESVTDVAKGGREGGNFGYSNLSVLPLFSDVAGNQPTVRVAGGQSVGKGKRFHLATLIATNEPNLHAASAQIRSWPGYCAS